jgi:hypothetical protein
VDTVTPLGVQKLSVGVEGTVGGVAGLNRTVIVPLVTGVNAFVSENARAVNATQSPGLPACAELMLIFCACGAVAALALVAPTAIAPKASTLRPTVALPRSDLDA